MNKFDLISKDIKRMIGKMYFPSDRTMNNRKKLFKIFNNSYCDD